MISMENFKNINLVNKIIYYFKKQMSINIPHDIDADEQLSASILARDVKDKISKLGESVSCGIRNATFCPGQGYDVVDQVTDEDTDHEYSFPETPKFCDYVMHPIRFSY